MRAGPVSIHASLQAHAHVHTWLYTYPCTYLCTCLHGRLRTCTHVNMSTCMSTLQFVESEEPMYTVMKSLYDDNKRRHAPTRKHRCSIAAILLLSRCCSRAADPALYWFDPAAGHIVPLVYYLGPSTHVLMRLELGMSVPVGTGTAKNGPSRLVVRPWRNRMISNLGSINMPRFLLIQLGLFMDFWR